MFHFLSFSEHSRVTFCDRNTNLGANIRIKSDVFAKFQKYFQKNEKKFGSLSILPYVCLGQNDLLFAGSV